MTETSASIHTEKKDMSNKEAKKPLSILFHTQRNHTWLQCRGEEAAIH